MQQWWPFWAPNNFCDEESWRKISGNESRARKQTPWWKPEGIRIISFPEKAGRLNNGTVWMVSSCSSFPRSIGKGGRIPAQHKEGLILPPVPAQHNPQPTAICLRWPPLLSAKSLLTLYSWVSLKVLLVKNFFWLQKLVKTLMPLSFSAAIIWIYCLWNLFKTFA